MTQSSVPALSRIWICWLVLMSMTSLSLWVGEPQAIGRLTVLAVATLLAASVVKATQILWVFLNLAHSTKTWKVTFLAFLGVIIAIVFACATLIPMFVKAGG